MPVINLMCCSSTTNSSNSFKHLNLRQNTKFVNALNNIINIPENYENFFNIESLHILHKHYSFTKDDLLFLIKNSLENDRIKSTRLFVEFSIENLDTSTNAEICQFLIFHFHQQMDKDVTLQTLILIILQKFVKFENDPNFKQAQEDLILLMAELFMSLKTPFSTFAKQYVIFSQYQELKIYSSYLKINKKKCDQFQ